MSVTLTFLDDAGGLWQLAPWGARIFVLPAGADPDELYLWYWSNYQKWCVLRPATKFDLEAVAKLRLLPPYQAALYDALHLLHQ